MSDDSQRPIFTDPGGEGLSPLQRAWRAPYETYWALLPMMDSDPLEHAGMDEQTYAVLTHTYLVGPAEIRMKDLAINTTLSTSGLTSLVDRLETRGLLEPKPGPSMGCPSRPQPVHPLGRPFAGSPALIRERGSQFIAALDEIFRSDGLRIPRTPVLTSVADAGGRPAAHP